MTTEVLRWCCLIKCVAFACAWQRQSQQHVVLLLGYSGKIKLLFMLDSKLQLAAKGVHLKSGRACQWQGQNHKCNVSKACQALKSKRWNVLRPIAASRTSLQNVAEPGSHFAVKLLLQAVLFGLAPPPSKGAPLDLSASSNFSQRSIATSLRTFRRLRTVLCLNVSQRSGQASHQ